MGKETGFLIKIFGVKLDIYPETRFLFPNASPLRNAYAKPWDTKPDQ
jgi:hypothetical protein